MEKLAENLIVYWIAHEWAHKVGLITKACNHTTLSPEEATARLYENVAGVWQQPVMNHPFDAQYVHIWIKDELRVHIRVIRGRFMFLLSGPDTQAEYILRKKNVPRRLRKNLPPGMQPQRARYRAVVLNPELVRSKGLAPSQVDRLHAIHWTKSIVLNQMDETILPRRLQLLSRRIQYLEYALQDVWGFKLDHTYHEWYRVPACNCPVDDNRRLKGVDRRIYSGICPVHSLRR